MRSRAAGRVNRGRVGRREEEENEEDNEPGVASSPIGSLSPPSHGYGEEEEDDDDPDMADLNNPDVTQLNDTPMIGHGARRGDLFGSSAEFVGRASSPPLYAQISQFPAAVQFRVWRLENGVPVALGAIDCRAMEDDFIEAFTNAMPEAGEGRKQFLLRPVDIRGAELGKEITINISEHHATLRAFRERKKREAMENSMPNFGPGGYGRGGGDVIVQGGNGGDGSSPFAEEMGRMFEQAVSAAEDRTEALQTTLEEERERLRQEEKARLEERMKMADRNTEVIQKMTERLMEADRARGEEALRGQQGQSQLLISTLTSVFQQNQEAARQDSARQREMEEERGRREREWFDRQRQVEIDRRAEDQRRHEADAIRTRDELSARLKQAEIDAIKHQHDLDARLTREREAMRDERDRMAREADARRQAEKDEADRRDKAMLDERDRRERAEREERDRRDKNEREEREKEREERARRDAIEREAREKLAQIERDSREKERDERDRREKNEREDRERRERADKDERERKERIENERLQREKQEWERRETLRKEEIQLQAKQMEMQAAKDKDHAERMMEMARQEREAQREAQAQRERAEREAREFAEKERQRAHERQLKEIEIQREQDREHASRMIELSKMQHGGTVGALQDMLGIDTPELLSKIFGGGEGGEGTSWTDAIPKILATVADLGKVALQNQGGGGRPQVTGAPARRIPVVPQASGAQPGALRQPQPAPAFVPDEGDDEPAQHVNPTPTPAAAPKSQPEVSPVPNEEVREKSPAKTVITLKRAKERGISILEQKKARKVIITLLDKMKDTPEAELETLIMETAFANPRVLEYIDAITVEAALVEAEVDPADAAKFIALMKKNPISAGLTFDEADFDRRSEREKKEKADKLEEARVQAQAKTAPPVEAAKPEVVDVEVVAPAAEEVKSPARKKKE